MGGAHTLALASLGPFLQFPLNLYVSLAQLYELASGGFREEVVRNFVCVDCVGHVVFP